MKRKNLQIIPFKINPATLAKIMEMVWEIGDEDARSVYTVPKLHGDREFPDMVSASVASCGKDGNPERKPFLLEALYKCNANQRVSLHKANGAWMGSGSMESMERKLKTMLRFAKALPPEQIAENAKAFHEALARMDAMMTAEQAEAHRETQAIEERIAQIAIPEKMQDFGDW